MKATWFKMLCVAAVTMGVGAVGFGEEAKKEKAADDYPLKTCVVSDEDLSTMGEPVLYQHEGRTVKFCCDHCIDTFKKDPAKYLKKIDDAKAKGGATTQLAKQG